jgi:hypothetical protein
MSSHSVCNRASWSRTGLFSSAIRAEFDPRLESATSHRDTLPELYQVVISDNYFSGSKKIIDVSQSTKEDHWALLPESLAADL